MSVKPTKQRQRILEVIRDAKGHLTAEEVYKRLAIEDHSIGIATVYRNLKYLYDNDLVNRIQHPDFGYVYDSNLNQHYHFHCLSCNRIMDIEDMVHHELNKEVEEKFGGTVHSHMAYFYGICPECLAKQEDN